MSASSLPGKLSVKSRIQVVVFAPKLWGGTVMSAREREQAGWRSRRHVVHGAAPRIIAAERGALRTETLRLDSELIRRAGRAWRRPTDLGWPG